MGEVSTNGGRRTEGMVLQPFPSTKVDIFPFIPLPTLRKGLLEAGAQDDIRERNVLNYAYSLLKGFAIAGRYLSSFQLSIACRRSEPAVASIISK